MQIKGEMASPTRLLEVEIVNFYVRDSRRLRTWKQEWH
jgi:hypothetical protein